MLTRHLARYYHVSMTESQVPEYLWEAEYARYKADQADPEPEED